MSVLAQASNGYAEERAEVLALLDDDPTVSAAHDEFSAAVAAAELSSGHLHAVRKTRDALNAALTDALGAAGTTIWFPYTELYSRARAVLRKRLINAPSNIVT